jgi:hypothetical protein
MAKENPPAGDTFAEARRNPQHSGEWRPDEDFNALPGIRITMRRIKGLTDPGVLKVPFRFQVPAMGDLPRPYRYEWARHNTLRLGERSRRQGRPLFELDLDTLLLDGPNQDDVGFVVWEGAPEPQRLIRELRWIMGDANKGPATPFRLTLSQVSVWPGEWLVNMPAVLTNVTPTQKAGEIGAEYLSLKFLEYTEDQASRRRRPRESEQTRRHKIAMGRDNLYEIAKRYYRSSSLWRAIAKKNGIKGVSPSSESELEKWCKRYKKTTLLIPPKPEPEDPRGPAPPRTPYGENVA